MAKVRLLHGKPLMIGGKVAMSDDCCCGGAFVCPDVDNITAAFTGMALDCGCVNILSPGSVIVTDINANGTFALTRTSSGFWFASAVAMVHLTVFSADGCSGSITFDSDVPLDCEVFCDVPGMGIGLFVGGFNLGVFTSIPASGLSGRPNEALCGVVDPDFGSTGVAHGGMATITV